MKPSPNLDAVQPAWLETLKQQVTSLRYGVVQVVVHDRRVVQIERTEKFRMEQGDDSTLKD